MNKRYADPVAESDPTASPHRTVPACSLAVGRRNDVALPRPAVRDPAPSSAERLRHDLLGPGSYRDVPCGEILGALDAAAVGFEADAVAACRSAERNPYVLVRRAKGRKYGVKDIDVATVAVVLGVVGYEKYRSVE